MRCCSLFIVVVVNCSLVVAVVVLNCSLLSVDSVFIVLGWFIVHCCWSVHCSLVLVGSLFISVGSLFVVVGSLFIC